MPYWSSDIDIEVSQRLPWGFDYRPVKSGMFFEAELRRAAAYCLNHGSEFLFMNSQATGCVGTAVNDNFYLNAVSGNLNPGFIMLLGHSDIMEHLAVRAILDYYKSLEKLKVNDEERAELIAGIARCFLWDNQKLISVVKVIAVTSSKPFFDPTDFLKIFADIVSIPYANCMIKNAPYYAEEFGYKRFNMLYDADYDPYKLELSSLLREMKFDETKSIVGDTPDIDFPDFNFITGVRERSL